MHSTSLSPLWPLALWTSFLCTRRSPAAPLMGNVFARLIMDKLCLTVALCQQEWERETDDD